MPSRGPPGLSGLIEARRGDRIQFEVTVRRPTKVVGQLALAGPLVAPAAVHVFACGKYTREDLEGPAKLSEKQIVVPETGRFELLLAPGEKSLSAVWRHGSRVMLATRNFQLLEGATLDLGLIQPREDAITALRLRFIDDTGHPFPPAEAIGTEQPLLSLMFNAVGRRSAGQLDRYLVDLSGESWTLIGLTPGEWQFIALLQTTGLRPGVERPESAAAMVTLPASRPVELSLVVKRRVALSVRAVGPESKQRIRIKTFAMNLDTNDVVRTKGYSDQRQDLMVSPGRQLIWMTSQRYGLEDDFNLYAEGQMLASPQGSGLSEASIELVLVPARRLAGRIVGPEVRGGAAVVSFNLSGFPRHEQGLVHVKADGEGRVVLSGIPPHREPTAVPPVRVRWN